jgi:hypothetical protein
MLSMILLKINRLFLVRDAKFKMNQKKNPSNSKFSTSTKKNDVENFEFDGFFFDSS